MKQQIWSLVVSLVLAAFCVQDGAAQFVPVDQGSSVTFTIRNLGINSKGSFSGLEGRIVFDPAEPSKSVFDVSVSTASVNTDNNMRDEHLRKESYFDAEHHPRIRFVSTGISAGDKKGNLIMHGKLTIKNTTKEISFPFTAEPKDGGYLFNGEFRIDRKDFEVGGSSTLSNGLTVHLSVLAKKG